MTVPAMLASPDPMWTGQAAFLRHRPIAIGAGGLVAGIGIIAVLMRRRGSWPWFIVGGLTIQALGLGIYWIGWLPTAVGPVTRRGASFETVSMSVLLLADQTFVLLLATALAVFFALPAVRGAMAGARRGVGGGVDEEVGG